MKEKVIRYGDIKNDEAPAVYVIQEIPGTAEGRPKINIMGAANYGKFKFLLPELSQIIFSPSTFTISFSLTKYEGSRIKSLFSFTFPFLISIFICIREYFSSFFVKTLSNLTELSSLFIFSL